MDIANGIIVLGSLTAIVLFVAGTAGWAIKKWIQTQFADNVSQLLPNLLNGDTPVAVYAHQARDASREAKDAALDAKDAACAARDAATDARKAAMSLKVLVRELKQVIKDRGKIEIRSSSEEDNCDDDSWCAEVNDLE